MGDHEADMNHVAARVRAAYDDENASFDLSERLAGERRF